MITNTIIKIYIQITSNQLVRDTMKKIIIQSVKNIFNAIMNKNPKVKTTVQKSLEGADLFIKELSTDGTVTSIKELANIFNDKKTNKKISVKTNTKV